MNFTKIARQEAASFWEGSFEHPFITASVSYTHLTLPTNSRV